MRFRGIWKPRRIARWSAPTERTGRGAPRLQVEQLEARLVLASYFVSPTGSDLNLGTLQAPFLTIAQAMDRAQPGDNVLLRGGTYRETINSVRSGLPGEPITVSSYNGEPVFISASELVSGPWVESAPGTGIYSAPVTDSLPTRFWNQSAATAGGTGVFEIGGRLVATVVNDADLRTATIRSASPSSAWNFFSEPVTWRVRGLSITSSGTTAMPLDKTMANFSIQTSSGSGYSADDSINVRFTGNGALGLRLKRDTVNSWGTSVGTVTNLGITGFDLTLGPGTTGNVAYSLVAFPTGQVVASGQWGITQANWSDGGSGTSSYLQIFAQESVTPTLDSSQRFNLNVESYQISAGGVPVLQDDFEDGDLINADYFPSGRNTGISSGYDQLFVDGEMQFEARYANKLSNDLLAADGVPLSLSNTYTLTGSAFSGKPDNFFAGARFLGRVGQGWSWQTSVVDSSSGSSLRLNSAAASNWWWPNYDNKTVDTGTGFVYGKLEFLDADQEWHLQQNARGPDKLYLRMVGGANPSGHVVEHKVRNWTVNINGHDNIVVSGLQLRGGAVRLNGSGLVLENCDARNLSHFLVFSQGSSANGDRVEGGGVVVSGANNIVRGCTLYDTAGSGIVANDSGHLLTRNLIHDTDYSGTYAAGISLSGRGHTASFNTIHDSGRDILRLQGAGLNILYNDLSRAGRMAQDLGIVYSYGTNGTDAGGNATRIAYNWIHDHGNPANPVSRGIYLDNYSRNFIVDHNVIWDFNQTVSGQAGITLNSPTTGTQIYHNTLVGAAPYNLTTWSGFPDNNPDSTFWTTNNHGMDYVAQNNLVIPAGADVDAIFENYAEQDFRPRAGSIGVDPAPSNGTVEWVTTDGVTNVPAGFKLTLRYKSQQFVYREVTGQGMVLPGINDRFAGISPDSGAYERGGPSWSAGVDGHIAESIPIDRTGFQWGRQADWTARPARDAGTTSGNPDDDSAGDAVWSYESVPIGGARGQANVWFEQLPTRLKWDPSWFGDSVGAWATGDDTGSSIQPGGLTQVLSADSVPVVRWTNPLPLSIAVDITGNLIPNWLGGAAGSADIVMLRQLLSGEIVPLVQVVRNSADDAATRNIPVNLRNVTLGAGESVLISLRHQPGRANGGSIHLGDDLTITLRSTIDATIYFVASNGSDDNVGTLDAPFRTISKAAAVMRPGDRTFIRGGTYRETVVPASDDVYFGAYNNEPVVISGSDVLTTTWGTHNGSIQKATVNQEVLQVFVNAAAMNLASYPNFTPGKDLLNYKNWTSTTTRTPKLPNGQPALGSGQVDFSSMSSKPAGYWVGGYYTGRNGSNPSTAARGVITASSGRSITLGELNFDWRGNATAANSVGSGHGYIIDHLNALDSETEWYWSNGTLYLQPPSGVSLPAAIVEARTRLWGMDLSNRTGVVVEGIDFHAASIRMQNSQRSEIRDADVLYPSPWSGLDVPSPINGQRVGLDYGGQEDGSTGLFVSGSDNRIYRTYIAHSWGGAIRLEGQGNSIERSRIEDVNWFGRRIGAVQIFGLDNHVLGNSILRAGQSGIDGGNRLAGLGKVGLGIDVRYNDVRNVGLLTSDTAHFYVNNHGARDSRGRPSLINAVVAYNVFINNYSKQNGAGIYFDNGTAGASIHHNVVSGVGLTTGIRLQKFAGSSSGIREIYVYNNTVIGGSKGIAVLGSSSSGSVATVVFRNNLTTKGVSGATLSSHNKSASLSWFVNASAHDYRLKSSATSAIDAALAIPGITDDLFGPAPDLGAFEYRKL